MLDNILNIEETVIQEIIDKGGVTLWPLLFLSILSLGTILERLGFWASVAIGERETVNRVLEAARYDWRVAYEIARQASKQPIGRFLYAPLRLNSPNPEAFRLALEAAADNELASMRRGEKVLEATIALAPLLGLLGTVFGLINSLGSIRLIDIGTDAASNVTTGIGEALISTAVGLVVAVVSGAFYRLFQGFLFSQIKMFRRCGNELELLYRQYWAYLEKNPDAAVQNQRDNKPYSNPEPIAENRPGIESNSQKETPDRQPAIEDRPGVQSDSQKETIENSVESAVEKSGNGEPEITKEGKAEEDKNKEKAIAASTGPAMPSEESTKVDSSTVTQ
ncbi:MAG: MotA/TolQ/ExbB proton channel family protein [Oscillatoria sp. SIO1A7]|nr:MotA/TolQ/ExbB proton channel family protein [Oscillatoria sp. SIO1A7]